MLPEKTEHLDTESEVHPLAESVADTHGFLHLAAQRPARGRTTTWAYHDAPIGVCLHYTATRDGTAEAICKRDAGPLGDNESSVHFYIEADGMIYQSVSLKYGAWHAGSASAAWVRVVDGKLVKRGSVKQPHFPANRTLISVEFINLGRLKKVGKAVRAWPFTDDAPEVRDASRVSSGWHTLTAQQVEAWHTLRATLEAHYGHVLPLYTHAAIDPERKADPGPVILKQLGLPESLLKP